MGSLLCTSIRRKEEWRIQRLCRSIESLAMGISSSTEGMGCGDSRAYLPHTLYIFACSSSNCNTYSIGLWNMEILKDEG